MRKYITGILIGACLFFCGLNLEAEKKPNYVIELVYRDWKYENGIATTTLHLVLPDGSHALAVCPESLYERNDCRIELFDPEKQSPDACKRGFNEEMCTYREYFFAERRENYVMIYAANGKVYYHITGSW